MKKNKLAGMAILLCFLCSCEKNEEIPCSNQYIIAGASDQCFEIIDIDPDSIVSAFSEMYGSPKSSLHYYETNIDISLNNEDGFWNKNGNIDFQIKCYYSTAGGMAITDQGINLLTFDNKYLEYSATEDSAYLCIYNPGDSIHNKNLWLNINEIRLSRALQVLCPPFCPGTNYFINRSLTDQYIGLRIAGVADTSYFWVKIDIKDYHQLTIKEFGRRRK